MAFSVEARIPFLDHKLVERCLVTDSSLKIQNGQNKSVLRRIMKNKLPNLILERNNKIGFDTPQAAWFREKEFTTFTTNLIKSSRFNKRRIFDSKKILSMLEDHYKKKKDYSEILWKVVHVEMWYRIFIDKVN